MTIPWNELPYIGTVEELERFGTPVQRNRDKVLAGLQEVHREWIAACPLIFVGTSAGDGTCDVSPKGDPPGFVRVLDDFTLAIPERVGNQRMDGFRNILSNPRVGLIFLIPGRSETLRVNGSARLVTDGPFFDDLIVRYHRPHLALLVHADEVFFHCPKAFARSYTWKPERWNPRAVRSFAQIAKALWRSDQSIEEIERHYQSDDAATDLYPATDQDIAQLVRRPAESRQRYRSRRRYRD